MKKYFKETKDVKKVVKKIIKKKDIEKSDYQIIDAFVGLILSIREKYTNDNKITVNEIITIIINEPELRYIITHVKELSDIKDDLNTNKKHFIVNMLRIFLDFFEKIE